MEDIKSNLDQIHDSSNEIMRKLFLLSAEKELTPEQVEKLNDCRETFDIWRRRMFEPAYEAFFPKNERKQA